MLPPPKGHVGGEYTQLASVGELGWEGCADKEIVLSKCGLSPPTTGSPRSASPAKPRPPAQKPKPPALPPSPPNPQTVATQKALSSKAQVLRIGQQLIVARGTHPWSWEVDEGEAAPAVTAARGTPVFGGE